MNSKRVAEVVNEIDVLSLAIKRRYWSIICETISKESVSLDCLNTRQTWSLLRFSVKFNNLSIFKKLIDEKISLNSFEASSLLWLAVTSGHTEIASELVRLGADLTRRRRGCTFLQKLAMKCNERKNIALAILMLDHGADMNALHGRYHKCAFNYAVRKRCTILEREFIKRGACVRYYLLPKMYRHDEDITLFDKALRIFVDEEIRNNRLVSLLWDLGRFYDQTDTLKAVEEVLALGLSVDERSKNSRLLRNLVCRRQLKMVSRLLDHGFDCDFEQSELQSALVAAARYKRSHILEWLLKKGADVNVCCEKTKYYPLHEACHREIEENVKLLLLHGADINIKDKYGFTIDVDIDEKIRSIIIKQVAFLVSKGAEVDESYFEMFNCDSNNRIKYDIHLIELQKMKSTIIFSDISLFSFLTHLKLVSFALRNPICLKNYHALKLETSFPLYYQEINIAFVKAMHRKRVLADKENAFCERVFDILPGLVIETILMYFYFIEFVA